MVYFCYIDESGTPQIPGNTSHYVLCGISIPVKYWKKCDRQINKIKAKYALNEAEIHTGWIKRTYFEQSKIDGFDKMNYSERRSAVLSARTAEIYRVKKTGNSKALKQLKKNYENTNSYIHLTFSERMDFLREVADTIGSWSFVRIFAECIDKVYFDSSKAVHSTDEQAFEQIVSRFEYYLNNISHNGEQNYGLLIHDNNLTECVKLTSLMKVFHKKGTFWTKIRHIIETPLFVDSSLTGMIQLADLCALALRRYLENGETDLLNRIKPRFDNRHGKVVGVRHFSKDDCTCELCQTPIKTIK